MGEVYLCTEQSYIWIGQRYPPPPDRTGVLHGRAGVPSRLATLRAVRLLRSRRRTILLFFFLFFCFVLCHLKIPQETSKVSCPHHLRERKRHTYPGWGCLPWTGGYPPYPISLLRSRRRTILLVFFLFFFWFCFFFFCHLKIPQETSKVSCPHHLRERKRHTYPGWGCLPWTGGYPPYPISLLRSRRRTILLLFFFVFFLFCFVFFAISRYHKKLVRSPAPITCVNARGIPTWSGGGVPTLAGGVYLGQGGTHPTPSAGR